MAMYDVEVHLLVEAADALEAANIADHQVTHFGMSVVTGVKCISENSKFEDEPDG